MSCLRHNAMHSIRFALISLLLVGCGGGTELSSSDQESQTTPVVNEDTQPSDEAQPEATEPESQIADAGEKPADASADRAETETNPPASANAATDQQASQFAGLVSEAPGARDTALAALDADPQASKRAAASLLQTSPSKETRLGAAFYLLDRFDAADEPQKIGVIAALADDDAAVRNIALQLVLRTKTLAVENLDAVAKLMNDPQAAASSRVKAIRGLATMPEAAASVLEPIRQAAKSAPEASVRSAAVYTLSKVDASDAGLAVVVDRLKSDEDSAVRSLAAARLGRMAGGDAAALCAALRDPEDKVRDSAANSLGRLGESAVAPLVAVLEDKDVEVRRRAIVALGKNGSAALSALPRLKQLGESDPDEKIRQLAKLTARVIQAAR